MTKVNAPITNANIREVKKRLRFENILHLLKEFFYACARVGTDARRKTRQVKHSSRRYPLGNRRVCQQGSAERKPTHFARCSGRQPLIFQHSGFSAMGISRSSPS